MPYCILARRLQLVLQAWQSGARADAERRDQLHARIEGLKAQLLAIASVADAGAPPGVDGMYGRISRKLR